MKRSLFIIALFLVSCFNRTEAAACTISEVPAADITFLDDDADFSLCEMDDGIDADDADYILVACGSEVHSFNEYHRIPVAKFRKLLFVFSGKCNEAPVRSVKKNVAGKDAVQFSKFAVKPGPRPVACLNHPFTLLNTDRYSLQRSLRL
jgi:hypothetical protein